MSPESVLGFGIKTCAESRTYRTARESFFTRRAVACPTQTGTLASPSPCHCLDQHPVLPADGAAQLRYRRFLALHELDEHHVHVVEDEFAERAGVRGAPHQTELLQLCDQRADLVGERTVEPGIGLAERAARLLRRDR